MQTWNVARAEDTTEDAKIIIDKTASMIGVVGLEDFGSAYARTLIGAGFRVIAHDPDLNRIEPLLEAGFEGASGVAGLAACDAVITCLPDDAVLEPMVLGEGELVHSMPAGSLHITLCTISLELSRRFKAAHETAGQHYVMALAFSAPELKQARDVMILATGSDAGLTRALPLLKHCGSQIFILNGTALETAGGGPAVKPGE